MFDLVINPRVLFQIQNPYYFNNDLKCKIKLHKGEDEYPLCGQNYAFEQHITRQKQHQLRTQLFEAACLQSQKLIFSLSLKNTTLFLAQLISCTLIAGSNLLKSIEKSGSMLFHSLRQNQPMTRNFVRKIRTSLRKNTFAS